MRRFLRDNGLSFTLVALFLAIFAGQIVAGHLKANDDREAHGLPPQSYAAYVTSPAILAAS